MSRCPSGQHLYGECDCISLKDARDLVLRQHAEREAALAEDRAAEDAFMAAIEEPGTVEKLAAAHVRIATLAAALKLIASHRCHACDASEVAKLAVEAE